MKKLGITTTTIALCGTLQALAQTATTPDSTAAATSPNGTWSQNGNHLGKLDRADKIIGREVVDAQGQKLGSAKDLAIDLQNGRIVEVIVGTGGLLGLNERYVAVTPDQFSCDPQKKVLDLNVDKTKLAQAPAFKLADWNANTSQANLGEVYSYYGSQPWFAADGQAAQNNARAQAHLGQIQRADKFIGTTVRNMQNERLGRVDDLIVDLRSGRIAEVVIASGGFLGVRDEYSSVPPQSFRQGAEADTVMLDTTKEALANAPHFMSSQWDNAETPEYVTTVYQSYNVTPYFDATGNDLNKGADRLEHNDNTAVNAQDRSGATLTPINQGTSEADMDTTRQIRRQVMQAEGLSVNARNCKIITLDGKVTLRGTVNTDDEKRIIGDIAAKVASRANVDNQLMVENTARTSAQ